MTDVLLVVAMIAAFAAFAGFVAVCARIIGPDPEGVELATDGDAVDEQAVGAAA